jgi:hypothetical protein
VPERDFIDGYALVYGLAHDDPKRLRLMMLEALDEAFPFHPALPQRILLRLNALSDMWRHPMMDAWRGASTHAMLSDTALRIAATQPLCEDGWFNAESFFAEMLRRIDGDGSA